LTLNKKKVERELVSLNPKPLTLNKKKAERELVSLNPKPLSFGIQLEA